MYYILKDKRPVKVSSVLECGEWLENTKDRIVDKTVIADVEVSTVFIGLDHNFSGHGEPLLFETLVFGENYDTTGMQRCSTWEQAEKQHNDTVERIKKMLDSSLIENNLR